jgi:hypothetical protein
MEKVNSIYKEVEIESTDLVLNNLSKEIKQKDGKVTGDDMSSADTMALLRALQNNKPTEK